MIQQVTKGHKSVHVTTDVCVHVSEGVNHKMSMHAQATESIL